MNQTQPGKPQLHLPNSIQDSPLDHPPTALTVLCFVSHPSIIRGTPPPSRDAVRSTWGSAALGCLHPHRSRACPCPASQVLSALPYSLHVCSCCHSLLPYCCAIAASHDWPSMLSSSHFYAQPSPSCTDRPLSLVPSTPPPNPLECSALLQGSAAVFPGPKCITPPHDPHQPSNAAAHFCAVHPTLHPTPYCFPTCDWHAFQIGCGR